MAKFWKILVTVCIVGMLVCFAQSYRKKKILVCPKPAYLIYSCADTCETDEDCKAEQMCCAGSCSEEENVHPMSKEQKYYKTCVDPVKDNCQDYPCKNGGTCTNLLNDYQCHCPRGYEGKNCTEETKACPKPTDLMSQCGDFCDTDVDCKKPKICCNGSCPKHPVPPYTKKVYYKACVHPDPCVRKCSGHGNCTRIGLETYICQCEAGYGQPDCDYDIDDCYDKPCQNGGSCIDFLNGYQCCCPLGYTGKNCTEDNFCPIQNNVCEKNKCQEHPNARCYVTVHYVIEEGDRPIDVTEECVKRP